MKISEQRYRELLAIHDWRYDYSEDYSVWAKGKSHAGKIMDLQPEIDPEFKIWNEYAPADYKRSKK